MTATVMLPADMLQKKIDLAWTMVVLFGVMLTINLIPESAFAATNAIEDTLCKVKNLMTSGTGRAIATVAVIVVGIGALMGKISWGMAFIVAVGIALVFGASTIVDAVAPAGSTGGGC